MGFLDGIIDIAPNVTRITTIGDFFGIAINLLIGVGVSIAVIYIILSGIRFIMSQGDPKSVEQAKQALTYSIVALIISIGAIAFKNVLNSIMGVTDDLVDDITVPGTPAPDTPGGGGGGTPPPTDSPGTPGGGGGHIPGPTDPTEEVI